MAQSDILVRVPVHISRPVNSTSRFSFPTIPRGISDIMEAKFRERMRNCGLSEESITVMEDEGIGSDAVFRALLREHVMKLLEVMKVGQHALLLEMWDGPSQVNYPYLSLVS